MTSMIDVSQPEAEYDMKDRSTRKPCAAVRRMLDEIRIGEPATQGALSCVPLVTQTVGGPLYKTLGEAVELGALTVSEVDESGSVAELLVVNGGDFMVLLLDGEELVGAKQNRCLNASILIAPHSSVVVPVSCTEHGRWTAGAGVGQFRESGNIMAHKTRMHKTAAVHNSLRANESWASRESQNAVWSEVDKLSARTKAFSPTGAMSDVFSSQESSLIGAVESLSLRDGQAGSVFVAGGRVMGLDLVSRPSAYAQVHRKLVRCYALDAFLTAEPTRVSPKDAAIEFLADLRTVCDEAHCSVGCGTDHRLGSSTALGSALVYRNRVVHMVYLSREFHPDE